MKYPALSIVQPWPWLILRPDVEAAAERSAARASGRMKDVENRVWRGAQRGWVLVHASGSRLPRASKHGADWDSAALFAAKRGVEVPLQASLPHGAVVGAMRIDGCEAHVRSPWFVGPWGYILGETVPFAQPVGCLGALKFFTLPPAGGGPGGDELAEQLTRAICAAGLAAEFRIHP